MNEEPTAVLIDPSANNLKDVLQSLEPTTGFCILADIVGSTEMKNDPLESWIARIYNTFKNMEVFLPSFTPLKAIGDELMYFVPDTVLQRTRRNVIQLFDGLVSIVNEPDTHLFRDVRIAVAYCQDAYAITFVPGTIDYYGKDIDLTSRLLSKANAREIIMNEMFVEQLRQQYEKTGNWEQFTAVTRIVGPWPEHFKGFDDYVPVYKLPFQSHEKRR